MEETPRAAATISLEMTNYDDGNDPPVAEEQAKAELRDLLTSALALLARHRASSAPVSRASSPGTDPRSLQALVSDTSDAFNESVWGCRTNDDGGERLLFDFLAAPSRHEVAFRSTEPDLFFRDGPTLAERAGCMRCTNTFNFVMYGFMFTLGNLMNLSTVPMGLLVMAGLWDPGEGGERVLLGFWLLRYIAMSAWFLSYWFSYVHLGVAAATLGEHPAGPLWFVITRTMYTVGCCFYSPTVWNVSALCESYLAMVYHLSDDACLVRFRLRWRREQFMAYFGTPKRPSRAMAQWAFGAVSVLLDVLRHLAVLHVVATDRSEIFPNVTLRQLVNTSFGASIIMQLHVVKNSMFKGFGQRVRGRHTGRAMFDTK